MTGKRTKNSELRLNRLEDEEVPRPKEHGILELFEEAPEPRDEDEPLERDPAE